MMTEEDIFWNLCNKDPRYPEHNDLYGFEDEPPTPRENCSCDNCFYRRDELAMEILKLRKMIMLPS